MVELGGLVYDGEVLKTTVTQGDEYVQKQHEQTSKKNVNLRKYDLYLEDSTSIMMRSF